MRYTDSHEWVLIQGNVGKIGISEYAQKELGEVVSIAFPQVGQVVRAGEEICVLESTKAASDVYSPVSGKVIAINENLKENPDLINQSPEKLGWLFQVELADVSEVERLLSPLDYQKLISL